MPNSRKETGAVEFGIMIEGFIPSWRKFQANMSREEGRTQPTSDLETATLGGGCFWCTEAVFVELGGVTRVESGYSGGRVPNPSYEDVCTGETGHAEAVQVTYDSRVISYKELLRIFFTIHDPTSLNRQGNDIGNQYRSVIFYHNEEQKRIAQEVIKEIDESKIWDRQIVTELAPFKAFHRAEEYHQEYFKRNPSQPYCRMVIAPKVAKFRKHCLGMLKKQGAESQS